MTGSTTLDIVVREGLSEHVIMVRLSVCDFMAVLLHKDYDL